MEGFDGRVRWKSSMEGFDGTVGWKGSMARLDGRVRWKGLMEGFDGTARWSMMESSNPMLDRSFDGINVRWNLRWNQC